MSFRFPFHPSNDTRRKVLIRSTRTNIQAGEQRREQPHCSMRAYSQIAHSRVFENLRKENFPAVFLHLDTLL